MGIVFSTVLAVFPALYLLRYFYLKDRLKPEPTELILKLFFLGVIAVIPVLFIETIMQFFFIAARDIPVLNAFISAFLVAALCEEFIKYSMVMGCAYKDVAFDERMDGIVYCITAGLGFACAENIMYAGYGAGTLIIRAFTAVPAHALCGGFMGYYMGQAKFAQSEPEESMYLRKAFISAFLIHGFYDFFLMASPYIGSIFAYIVIPLLVILWSKLMNMINSAISRDIAENRIVPEQGDQ